MQNDTLPTWNRKKRKRKSSIIAERSGVGNGSGEGEGNVEEQAGILSSSSTYETNSYKLCTQQSKPLICFFSLIPYIAVMFCLFSLSCKAHRHLILYIVFAKEQFANELRR